MEFLTRNNPNSFYNTMDPSTAAQWVSYHPSPSDVPPHLYPPGGYFSQYHTQNYPYPTKTEDGPRNSSPFELKQYQDYPFNYSDSNGGFPAESANRTHERLEAPPDSSDASLYKKLTPPFTPEGSESDFSPSSHPHFPVCAKSPGERIVNNNYYLENSLSGERQHYSTPPADYQPNLPKLKKETHTIKSEPNYPTFTNIPPNDEEHQAIPTEEKKSSYDPKSTEDLPKFPQQYPNFPSHSSDDNQKRTSSPADRKAYFDPKGSPESLQSGLSQQEFLESFSTTPDAMIALGSDGAPIIFPWMNKKGKRDYKKRSRQQYTRLQTCHLEQEFRTNAYLTKCRRQQVADSLGLSERQIKIWFQNRRMKWKKTNKGNPEAVLGPIPFNG